MRVIIFSISLLMVGFIYFLFAGSDLYILQTENNDQADVVKWIYNNKMATDPIPVSRTGIQFADKKINYTSNLILETEKGNYIGTVKILGEKRNPDLHVEWYSTNGNPLGTFIDAWQFDYPFPTYRIDSDTGNLIAIDIFTKARVINSTGRIINEFNILPEYHYNSENVLYTEVKNNRLIAAICQVIPHKDKNPTCLTSIRIFDLQGKMIMQYEKTDWQLQALGSSVDGTNIAISLYRWTENHKSEIQFDTMILNDNGDIIYQIPIGFQKIIFNDDNDRLLLIDKNLSYLYDVSNKRHIGTYTTLDKSNLFLAATFLPPSENIALQEGQPGPGIPGSVTPWKYNTIYIRTINKNGEELSPFLVENITLFCPSLIYNTETQSLFIGHSTGWKIFKIEN